MTKNQIISELFVSHDFLSCISKMQPVSLQEDLKSEVALVLLEKSEEKILELYISGGLKFYTVRVIINMIKSKSSPFYKKFRSVDTLELTSDLQVADQSYNEMPDIAFGNIDTLYWYDREIMKLYAEHGTYRKIEEVTGIPWESAYKTVQRSCKLIRKMIA